MKPSIHLMLDLETMGSAPDAPILQIGACAFLLTEAGVKETFIADVEWQSAFEAGRADAGTVRWWLAQNESARHGLLAAPSLERLPLRAALLALGDWISAIASLAQAGELAGVWSHGASFDLPILKLAFQRVLRRDVPWKFWTERDTRTLLWLAEQASGAKPKRPDVGTKHNARDDAVAQALWCQQAYANIVRAFAAGDMEQSR